MKLGIIVGHTEVDKGAGSDFLGAQEYDWNGDLADRMMAIDTPFEKRVFLRNGGGIPGAYRASDTFGSDITVELHFNAAHTTGATGTGVLYHPGSAKGRRFATLLREAVGEALGLADWPSGSGGVVTPHQASGQQQRGMASLSAGWAPATLIEPFFGSNRQDSARAAERKNDLAECILEPQVATSPEPSRPARVTA